MNELLAALTLLGTPALALFAVRCAIQRQHTSSLHRRGERHRRAR